MQAMQQPKETRRELEMLPIVGETQAIRARMEALQNEYSQRQKEMEREGARLVQQVRMQEGFASLRIELAQLLLVFFYAKKHRPFSEELVPGYVQMQDMQHFIESWTKEGADYRKLFEENFILLREGVIGYYETRLKEHGILLYDERRNQVVVLSKEKNERTQQIKLFVEAIFSKEKFQQEIQQQLVESQMVDGDGHLLLIEPSDEQIVRLEERLGQLKETKDKLSEETSKLEAQKEQDGKDFERNFLEERSKLPPMPFDGDLISAVIVGDIDALAQGLKQDKVALNRPLYDPSKGIYGKTLIYLACEYGQLSVVKYLLDKKRKEKARVDIPDQREGYYPIHAVLMQRPEESSYLAEDKWGDSENLQEVLDLLATTWKKESHATDMLDLTGEHGQTVLHTAAFFNCRAGLEWLFQHGVSKHLHTADRTPEGLLPLQCVMKRCCVESARLLLLKQADPHRLNAQGESALMMAHYYRHSPLIQLFISRGHFLTEEETARIRGRIGTRQWRDGPSIEEITVHERKTLNLFLQLTEDLWTMIAPPPVELAERAGRVEGSEVRQEKIKRAEQLLEYILSYATTLIQSKNYPDEVRAIVSRLLERWRDIIDYLIRPEDQLCREDQDYVQHLFERAITLAQRLRLAGYQTGLADIRNDFFRGHPERGVPKRFGLAHFNEIEIEGEQQEEDLRKRFVADQRGLLQLIGRRGISESQRREIEAQYYCMALLSSCQLGFGFLSRDCLLQKRLSSESAQACNELLRDFYGWLVILAHAQERTAIIFDIFNLTHDILKTHILTLDGDVLPIIDLLWRITQRKAIPAIEEARVKMPSVIYRETLTQSREIFQRAIASVSTESAREREEREASAEQSIVFIETEVGQKRFFVSEQRLGQQFKRLLERMLADCVKILGPIPNVVLILTGSMARSDAGPFADIELIVSQKLLNPRGSKDPKHLENKRRIDQLIQLLSLKVRSVGEHEIGFHLDPQGNPGDLETDMRETVQFCLRGTPKELFERCKVGTELRGGRFVEPAHTPLYQLCGGEYLWGDETLWKTFREKRDEFLTTEGKGRGASYLTLHQGQLFDPERPGIEGEEMHIKRYVSPIIYLVHDLILHYGLRKGLDDYLTRKKKSYSTMSAIDFLVEKEIIESSYGQDLKQALAIAQYHRAKGQLVAKKQQDDRETIPYSEQNGTALIYRNHGRLVVSANLHTHELQSKVKRFNPCLTSREDFHQLIRAEFVAFFREIQTVFQQYLKDPSTRIDIEDYHRFYEQCDELSTRFFGLQKACFWEQAEFDEYTKLSKVFEKWRENLSFKQEGEHYWVEASESHIQLGRDINQILTDWIENGEKKNAPFYTATLLRVHAEIIQNLVFFLVSQEAALAGYNNLCLMSKSTTLEKGKIYLREKDGRIAYTMITPIGEIVRDGVIDTLRAPKPFKLDKLEVLRRAILEAIHTDLEITSKAYYDFYQQLPAKWQKTFLTSLLAFPLYYKAFKRELDRHPAENGYRPATTLGRAHFEAVLQKSIYPCKSSVIPSSPSPALLSSGQESPSSLFPQVILAASPVATEEREHPTGSTSTAQAASGAFGEPEIAPEQGYTSLSGTAAPATQPPEALRYKKIYMPGGGHCLFHAVGLYLHKDYQQLRQEVVDYIQAHLDEFRAPLEGLLGDRTVDDYLQALRAGNEWADDLEISVLMRIYNRPILIISERGIRHPTVELEFTGEPIYVYYNGRDHYDGVVLEPPVLAGLAQPRENSPVMPLQAAMHHSEEAAPSAVETPSLPVIPAQAIVPVAEVSQAAAIPAVAQELPVTVRCITFHSEESKVEIVHPKIEKRLRGIPTHFEAQHDPLVLHINEEGHHYDWHVYEISDALNQALLHERAMALLYECVIGGGTALSVVAKITIGEKSYAAVISKPMDDENIIQLDRLLQQESDPVLDGYLFSQFTLMHMLTLFHEKQEVSLFFDRNKNILMRRGPLLCSKLEALSYNNPLFCFTQMSTTPLAVDAVGELLMLSPMILLRHWLEQLRRYEEQIKQLFGPVTLPQGFITQIYKRLSYMQEILCRSTQAKIIRDPRKLNSFDAFQLTRAENGVSMQCDLLTTLQLLEFVDFRAGDLYFYLAANFPSAMERFRQLRIDRYPQSALRVGPPSDMPTSVLLSLNEAEQELVTLEQQQKRLFWEKARIKQAIGEMKLEELPAFLRVQVVNQLQWPAKKTMEKTLTSDEMGTLIEKQKKILAVLKNPEINPEVHQLILVGYQALDDQTLSEVFPGKDRLQKVTVKHDDTLQNIKIPSGFQLQVLTITDCEDLQSIEIPASTASTLTTLIIERCPKLAKIKVQAGSRFSHLQMQSIQDCPKLMINESGLQALQDLNGAKESSELGALREAYVHMGKDDDVFQNGLEQYTQGHYLVALSFFERKLEVFRAIENHEECFEYRQVQMRVVLTQLALRQDEKAKDIFGSVFPDLVTSFALVNFSAEEVKTLRGFSEDLRTFLGERNQSLLEKIHQLKDAGDQYKQTAFTQPETALLKTFLDEKGQKSLSAKLVLLSYWDRIPQGLHREVLERVWMNYEMHYEEARELFKVLIGTCTDKSTLERLAASGGDTTLLDDIDNALKMLERLISKMEKAEREATLGTLQKVLQSALKSQNEKIFIAAVNVLAPLLSVLSPAEIATNRKVIGKVLREGLHSENPAICQQAARALAEFERFVPATKETKAEREAIIDALQKNFVKKAFKESKDSTVCFSACLCAAKTLESFGQPVDFERYSGIIDQLLATLKENEQQAYKENITIFEQLRNDDALEPKRQEIIGRLVAIYCGTELSDNKKRILAVLRRHIRHIPPEKRAELITQLIGKDLDFKDSELPFQIAEFLVRWCQDFPIERQNIVTQLHSILTGSSATVISLVSDILSKLECIIPQNERTQAIKDLLYRLRQPKVSIIEVECLARLALIPPTTDIDQVRDGLLNVLKNSDQSIRSQAAKALVRCKGHLSSEVVSPILDPFIADLDLEKTSEEQESAMTRLSDLAPIIPAAKRTAIIDALLALLEAKEEEAKTLDLPKGKLSKKEKEASVNKLVPICEEVIETLVLFNDGDSSMDDRKKIIDRLSSLMMVGIDTSPALVDFSACEVGILKSFSEKQWRAQRKYSKSLYDKVQSLTTVKDYKGREQYKKEGFTREEVAFLEGLLDKNDQKLLSAKLKKDFKKDFQKKFCLGMKQFSKDALSKIFHSIDLMNPGAYLSMLLKSMSDSFQGESLFSDPRAAVTYVAIDSARALVPKQVAVAMAQQGVFAAGRATVAPVAAESRLPVGIAVGAGLGFYSGSE